MFGVALVISIWSTAAASTGSSWAPAASTVPPAPGVSATAEWVRATAGLRLLGRRAVRCGLGLRGSGLVLRLGSGTRSRALADARGRSLFEARNPLGNVSELLSGLRLHCAHTLYKLTSRLGLPDTDVDIHGSEALVQLLVLGVRIPRADRHL